MALIATVSLSCEKEKAVEHRYYIRYEAEPVSQSAEEQYKVLVTDQFGDNLIDAEGKFSCVAGPVKNGFQAYIYALIDNATRGYDVKIYVAQDNSPFVLRASGTDSQQYFINEKDWE